MKKVYLKPRFQGGPYHSLYKELVQYPPKGYQIFTDASSSSRPSLVYNFDRKMLQVPFVKDVWYNAKTLLYMGFQRIHKWSCNSDYDLVFASQQLIFSKLPWVVDFEFVNALVGYGNIKMCKGVVQKALDSKSCRKIMPWSNWAKRTLFRSLECNDFEEKIETVHIAVSPKNFVKKRNGDRLRLLFVGSTNRSNIYNFELKGGNETVEAFTQLSKKYDRLELVIRSWVPTSIRKRCSKEKNIRILHSPLRVKEVADLYASSDMFIFPSHANLGMAILDAMSYELPVIALGVYDVHEAITDMKTGVLIRPPKDVLYYTWNGGHNYLDKQFLIGIRRARPWLVDQLVEKTSLLIENDRLRQSIAREARYEVEQGMFSIRQRNKKLARIFGEATKG